MRPIIGHSCNNFLTHFQICQIYQLHLPLICLRHSLDYCIQQQTHQSTPFLRLIGFKQTAETTARIIDGGSRWGRCSSSGAAIAANHLLQATQVLSESCWYQFCYPKVQSWFLGVISFFNILQFLIRGFSGLVVFVESSRKWFEISAILSWAILFQCVLQVAEGADGSNGMCTLIDEDFGITSFLREGERERLQK